MPNPLNQNSSLNLGRPAIILAAIAMSAAGALFYNLLPLVLGMAQDYRHLDNSQIGFLGSAFFLGYLLSTGTGFFWIRRANWQHLALVMTPIAIASLVAAAFVSTYTVLLLLILITGASLSVIYGIGATLVGDLPNASRWYGMKIAVEALAGAAIMLIFPGTVIAYWGFVGLLCGMAACVGLLMLFAYAVPAEGVKHVEDEVQRLGMTASKPHLILSLLVLMLFFTGETAAWSFIERLGAESGFDPVTVGTILSLSLGSAVLGALLLAWVGERFGYFLPFLFACILFLVGLAGLCIATTDVWLYGVSACLVMFSVGFGLPISLGSTAKLDHDGRYVILTVAVIGCAAMVAPGAAGLLTEWGGREPLLIFCAALAAISIVCQWFVSRRVNSEVLQD